MKKPKRFWKLRKYPLVSSKNNQFIEKIIRVTKPNFPATFRINDGYISGIKWEQLADPMEYIEMDIINKSHSGWKSIKVMMTAEEFNQLTKKAYNKSIFKFFQYALRQKEVMQNHDFGSYFHFRGIDLNLFQVSNSESMYYTNGIKACILVGAV
jgi:hypothetical protein